MVSRYKKYWPQALLSILALFAATGYVGYTDHKQEAAMANEDPIAFAGPGVGPADPWTSTSTPSDAITQRIWGRDVKLTGYENLDCLGTDANGIVESGTCSAGGGSGSVGTSTTDVADQITFFSTNGATPALISGDSGFTYNSGADRLTVTYASSTGISSSYASSTLGYIGTLVLNTALADAYVSDTLTVGASGSVADGALSANVSLLGQTIGPTELASSDFGDFTCNGTNCTTDNGSIGVADLASVDFGDFTCNGSACSLDSSYQAADTDLTDLAGLTAAAGDIIYGNGTGDWAKLAAATNGQILALVSGKPAWVASTTFSGGLTYANGNVTADLGTSISVGELASADFGDWTCNGSTCTIDANSIALTTDTTGNYVESITGTAGQISVTNGSGAEDLDATLAFPSHVIFGAGGYESAIGSTTNATSTNLTVTGTASTSKLYADGLVTCNTNNNLTWAAGVFGCEADDTAAGAASPFTWATNYGVVNAATSSNPIWAQLGVNASSTSHFDNATSTLLTATTAWLTNLFIGADTLAEYIADTAGAFFTGNTETGITATYQDADNTVDLVCNTADTGTFGCLTSTDWNTFNGKQAGDSTLTALAAYNTNGLLAQTAADTFAGRTLTGTANQISVSNGDGVAGNPTLSIPADFRVSSSTLGGSTLLTNATTTSLAILNLSSASCDVKALTTGVIYCGTDATGAGGGWPFTPDTYSGVANQSTTTPFWLKNTMIIASTTRFTQASTSALTIDDPTSNTVVRNALNVQSNRIQFGPLKYPNDYVPSCPTCMYFSIDKTATGDDATIVLRDQGNARAEVGLVGDNDLVFKTVSGNYLSESFSTRLKIEGTGSAEPGNVGIGLGETTEASDLLSVGTGNAFTVDYVGNVTASTSITINNPDNGNAVLSILGQQQSGGGSYVRLRDNVQGTYGYFGQNSVINGGTAYSQFDIQNPQSAGTICMSAGARASATAGVNCDLFFAAANNLLTFSNASTTNFTVGSFLTIPAAADPAVNVSGVLAINTTQASSSLRFHDGTGERVVNVTYDRSTGPVASSTLVYYGAYGTAGTTSLPYMNAEHKFTVLAMRCRTDANTAYVQISDGSNLGTIVPCSTSAVRTTIATNGSFNEGENFNINFGSRSATGPNSITVTMVIRDDAD